MRMNEKGIFFFFKQKTAYEIGTGDWSSDVCSSDLTRLLSKSQQLANWPYSGGALQLEGNSDFGCVT